MSRFIVSITLAVGLFPSLAPAAAAQAAPAQQASLATDSAALLNHLGRWSDALSWSRKHLPAAGPDDKCVLRLDILSSFVSMGLLDPAASELKGFDGACASTAAAREHGAELTRIRAAVSLPPLPTTGLDFSAVDEFWRIADLLARDVEPSEDDWHRMASSVGYRLSLRVVQTTRRDAEIALRPSRQADFDSLSSGETDQANRLRHLRAVVTHRDALARYRDSLTRSLPVQQAVSLMAKFLPPHAADGKSPPLVAFGIFRDDAYSLGPEGVVIDLDHVYQNGGLTGLLAHEFHHSYLSALGTLRAPDGDSATTLYFALRNMRNEGIADLIDKPYPLSYPNSPGMAAYAKRYNEAYARTPAVIHSIDSALAVAADDSTKLPAVGRRVNDLLPSAGHYNGSYVAREIYETFGVDSLYPGVYDFFAFLRAFGEAEVKRGNPPPFSPKSVALLDALEKRYSKP